MGLCTVSTTLTLTLNQAALTQTLVSAAAAGWQGAASQRMWPFLSISALALWHAEQAWVVSWTGLLALGFAVVLYLSSGSVAVLMHRLRQGEPLPPSATTKSYYGERQLRMLCHPCLWCAARCCRVCSPSSSTRVVCCVGSNGWVIGSLLCLIFAMIITLAIVVFLPSIEFTCKACPPHFGSHYNPVAVYKFPTLTSQWAVFISWYVDTCQRDGCSIHKTIIDSSCCVMFLHSFQVAATCGLLVYDIVSCNGVYNGCTLSNC
jgi:hypothetical protein